MGAGVMCGCVLGWLMALCAFDIGCRRLPNFLTLPGAALVLIVAVVAGRGLPAVAGAVALGGLYLVVHMLAPAAMGAGDVKLAIGLGALTGAFGFDVWVLAALAAPLLTGVWAVAAVIRRAGSTVPHGPSMSVASAAAITLAIFVQ